MEARDPGRCRSWRIFALYPALPEIRPVIMHFLGRMVAKDDITLISGIKEFAGYPARAHISF